MQGIWQPQHSLFIVECCLGRMLQLADLFLCPERTFNSNSKDRCRSGIGMELTTFLCMLTLPLTGAFSGFLTRSALTTVNLLVQGSIFSWASWKHATVASSTLIVFHSLYLHSEDEFCIRSKLWWAFPSLSGVLHNEPLRNTNHKRKEHLSWLIVKYNHQCSFAIMKLVGGTAGTG